MKIGIIGYGSMGRMILEKISHAERSFETELLVSNRTKQKVMHLTDVCKVCESNAELASQADMIFLCIRPTEMKEVLEEIKDKLKKDSFLISLNGSIGFRQLERVCKNKIAKVIPSITAEVNQSQTLVCYNELVEEKDKKYLGNLLHCMGNVIELPENEMGMGS